MMSSSNAVGVGSTNSNNNNNSNSIIKRIREQNSKYIPLLKPNVDIDDYVSTVIKEENSELYCNELSSYIIDINDVSDVFSPNYRHSILPAIMIISGYVCVDMHAHVYNYRKSKRLSPRTKHNCYPACKVFLY